MQIMRTLMNTACISVARGALVGAAAFALMAAPAMAHHSFAMFDPDHPTSITGVVKELQWTNPHVALLVYKDVKPGETPELWTFETTGPGNLTRAGWTKRSFQPGDKVKIDFLPLRAGGHGGELQGAVSLTTGKTYGKGN
jgi:hypothetical protein